MSQNGKDFEQNSWYDLVEFYEVSDQTGQTQTISRQKISGFPALEDWEMGFGG